MLSIRLLNLNQYKNMKLLLTSGGLTNRLIVNALFDLVDKEPQDTSLVYIPTAANVEKGDKSWLINDLYNLKKQDFKSIDIADISAVDEKIWRPKLEEADVLFFEGGNSYYLMDWINKSGLVKLLPKMLETKVYMGLSAGSMITGPDINLRLSRKLYAEEVEKDIMPGLGLTDFYVLPHLNSPYFASRMEATLRKAMKEITRKTYALDDQSALMVVDGKAK